MRLLRLLAPLALVATAARAQTDYRNLDGNRPARIEDAEPTELHELELEIPTARLERAASGAYRWRTEPKLSFGMLPNAEFEVRIPMVYREGAVSPRGGVAGVGVGGAYELNRETLRWPALAVGVEAVLPAGSAAAPVAAASIRAMATRSFGFGRVHLNGSFGNYGVVIPPAPIPGDTTPAITCPAGTVLTPIGTCVTLPPDFPCIVSSRPGGGTAVVSACAPRAAVRRARDLSSAQAVEVPQPTVFESTRWSAGVGGDRTFALRSLLVVGDLFVDQLRGLDRPAEWTGELGLRQQFGVRSVIDAGLGRRFTGPDQLWYLNAGFAYSLGVH